MAKQKSLFSPLFFCLFMVILWCECEMFMGKKSVPVRVGAVLELNSTVGKMGRICLSMALNDFYSAHSDYSTKLALFFRDSKDDVVDAAAAVLDLMEKEQVQAIIGPQRSSEAKFAIELGRKAHVPIISFSATSPSLSPFERQFFIRAAYNDSAQVKALAFVVQAYGWQTITIIYEDTDYGNGLIPYLLDGFQEIGIRVVSRISIPLSYQDSKILKELRNLKEMHECIFLVHMTATLGSKFFLLVKSEGMMSEGYAWLVTQGLSTILDPIDDETVMGAMQGVLGVRPYIPTSRKLEIFKSRWKKKNSNLFCLWAYDTLWAMAMAVEKAGVTQSSLLKSNTSQSANNLEAIGTSIMGPRILKSLLKTSFKGLSGDFDLTKRELMPKTFEIFNVVGRTERILGYYNQDIGGFSQSLSNISGQAAASLASNEILKKPIWPGDTKDQPKKLRIGVPVKDGFTEFVKVQWHPISGKPKVLGFSIDVFEEAHMILPFPWPYDYIPFASEDRKSNGTYDELLNKIELQEFDVVVGDTTIVAYRSLKVDFTLPYSESGVSMVVLMKQEERDSLWIFLKPLSPALWLTTLMAFLSIGFVVWVLEHRINQEFRGPPDQQLSTAFWFSFSTLVFAHREKLLNGWTRFLVIIWVFVVLIISQSYTASFASMLTVKRLQPTYADIKEIQRSGHLVGYQNHSFVKEFLVKQLNFDKTRLMPYNTPEEYHDALSNGIQNGGVAAIFDEIPYIKRFLAKYCSKFQMIGPTYKTDGFGFAFPRESPLVSHFSRAILNVTEDKDKMDRIERQNFGDDTSCEDQGTLTPSDSLSVSSFGGLFIITGVVSMLSLLVHIIKYVWFQWPDSNTTHQEGSIWLRIVELAKHFDNKDLSSTHHFYRSGSQVYPSATSPESIARTVLNNIDDMHNHPMASTDRDDHLTSDNATADANATSLP